MDKIEGVPNGWRLVRIGEPKLHEWLVDSQGEPVEAKFDRCGMRNHCIIERIEPTYRPFANAAELKPHIDRWVRHVASNTLGKIIAYSETSVKFGSQKSYWEYQLAYESWIFEDGSPFGVEVA